MTPNEALQQHSHTEDEIDLLDVWRILVRQKWLILGGTFFCTMLAVMLALILPREYRAEVIMLPPLAETVGKLNVPNLNVNDGHFMGYFYKVEPLGLYDELIINLQSNRLQRQFFKENDVVRFLPKKVETWSDSDIFEKEFGEKLAVQGIKNNKGARGAVTISLDGRDPEQIATWLNSFVQLADKQTILAQTKSLSTKVQGIKDTISQRIESLRSFEKARRHDMIARLEEALVVAKNLGWVEQPDNPGVLYEQAKKDGVNMSFSLQEMPLYLRGSKVLQAEIDALKQRKNDDPFIPELRNLQEQFEFLSSVTQHIDNVHAMRVDRVAIKSDRPIKPKRKLIVVLGFVLGVLLSVFVAFVRNIVVSAKSSCAQHTASSETSANKKRT